MKEAEALLQTLREYPHAKAWLSFSCQDGNAFKDPSKSNILKTAFGENWADSVLTLSAKYGGDQLMGIGINCTAPSSIVPLLESLRNHPKIKLLRPETSIIVYPNSGESWNPEKGYFFGEKYLPFSDYCKEWFQYDVPNNTALGGCCQVFPSDIEYLHKLCFGTENKIHR